jgi:hypothetical protein
MNNEQFKDAYWTTVQLCLTELLEMPDFEARDKANEGRQRFDQGQRRRLPLAYHEEPFYTAFRLANPGMDRSEQNREADKFLGAYGEKYQSILDDVRGGEVMGGARPSDAHRREYPRQNPVAAAGGKRG